MPNIESDATWLQGRPRSRNFLGGSGVDIYVGLPTSQSMRYPLGKKETKENFPYDDWGLLTANMQPQTFASSPEKFSSLMHCNDTMMHQHFSAVAVWVHW